jgi:DNA helicase-2/ATP-dependent DNA helicase PcrA
MELRNDYDLNSQLSKLLHEFSNLDISLEDWTKNVQKRLKEEFELTIQIDLQLKKGTFSPFHKKKMAELFSGQMSKWSFPISTIHKVKGMTLDSILLFLHKNGHSISLVDIEPSNGQLTEYQTMIYVAMSRPKHLLAIAIENSVNNDDIIRRLGDKVIFI